MQCRSLDVKLVCRYVDSHLLQWEDLGVVGPTKGVGLEWAANWKGRG